MNDSNSRLAVHLTNSPSDPEPIRAMGGAGSHCVMLALEAANVRSAALCLAGAIRRL